MYISRNLEQWNAFLSMLQTAFKENKAQELLTLLLTADERDAVGLRLQIVSNMIKIMDSDFMKWVKEHLDNIEKK